MSMARVSIPAAEFSSPTLAGLEGAKRRLADGRLGIIPSSYNLGLIALAFPGVAVEVDGEASSPAPAVPQAAPAPAPSPMPRNADPAAPLDMGGYAPKLPLRPHQLDALRLCADARSFAIFHDPGLGKTATALAKAGRHHARGEIDALLIVTLNTVHRQWVDEQIPTHLAVPSYAFAYDKKPLPDAFYHRGDSLRVLSISFDALISKGGAAEVASYVRSRTGAITKVNPGRFLKVYAGRFMMVVDESHAIKTADSMRGSACRALGRFASHRLAMTGTPLAKALEDEWSQFRFLDESIVGVRYLSTFRAQYCVMGGYENRSVVGHKNVDQYLARVAPFCHRLRKEDAVDLPPKLYQRVPFDLSPEQRRHYDALKRNLLTQLDDGAIATAQNAAVLLTRLQQITSGVLVGEDGTGTRLENARLKALETLLESHEGTAKVLIWARFTHEIEDILGLLDPKKTGVAVSLYGATSPEDRKTAVDRFLNDPKCKYFVSNPAAGGTGLNLMGGCTTCIYYSNSYNAVHRWQSEDRIHRIGTTGTCMYYDLVARKAGDEKVLASLQSKRNLANMAHGRTETELDLLKDILRE